MFTVTDIQEKRGIVILSVDGCARLKVRKNHFAKRPVEIGDEIDPEEYENALAAIQFPDAYESALTALDFSARTAMEIERGLLAKGYVPPAAKAVVERLSENRLIDDRRLAGRIAESNVKKPVGVYALKRKLRAKGISEEDAEDALQALDEDQQRAAARQAAEKLYRRYRDLPSREARGKLSQALARRGFSWDAVRGAVDALIDGDDYE